MSAAQADWLFCSGVMLFGTGAAVFMASRSPVLWSFVPLLVIGAACAFLGGSH